jgi:uncharacterized membrane protein YagU involved in acid resistance
MRSPPMEGNTMTTHPYSRVVEGAAVGALATAPMTLAMLAAKPLMPAHEREDLPPEQVTSGVLRQAGVEDQISGQSEEQLAMAAHFLFGAAAGGLYSLVAPRDRQARAACGALFGLGVWTASYFGYLPALGVRHSAEHDSAGRHLQLALSHIVWGATTGWLLDDPR